MELTNLGTIGIYIGGQSVSATTGYPVLTNVPKLLTVTDGIELYVFADGLTSIRVLELA